MSATGFEPNEPLLWVGGSFCNPRHVPCVFIKESSNPKKIIVEVESPMGFKMQRTVHVENIIRKKTK